MLSQKRKRFTLKSGRIGLISDTHGLVRPEALSALAGVELILHAGDIGQPEVLRALQALAPLAAIKGNNDRGVWARGLGDILELQVNDKRLRVIHNAQDLRPSERADVAAVISGHSHKPSVAVCDGVLFVNPGSAGPRRFRLPVTVGLLLLHDGEVRAEIVPLL